VSLNDFLFLCSENFDLEADEHFAKCNQLVKFVKESAMRTNSFFGQVLADTEPNKKLNNKIRLRVPRFSLFK